MISLTLSLNISAPAPGIEFNPFSFNLIKTSFISILDTFAI